MNGNLPHIKAGKYYTEDESSFIELSMSDNGVMVEIGDLVAEIFYAFTLSQGKVSKFECGEIIKHLEKNQNV